MDKEPFVNLTDLNRHRRIGASGLLLEMGPYRILVDAGLDPKEIGYTATPDFKRLGDGPLDLIILTHCHLDHLGSLPMVARRHPQTPVLCSRPSQFLAARMLRNSLNVMKRQREELSITEYPLYSKADINLVDEVLHPLPYGETRHFGHQERDLSVTLYAAGHVAGAAGVKITYRHRTIFITGDVLFTHQRTLPGASFPEENFDTVIMETTRGRTERNPEKPREEEVARLLKTIHDTLSHRGSVLLPVFALGRMQEILTLLRDAMRDKRIPTVPVFASGLGLDLVDFFDAIARKTGALNFGRGVLKELGVRTLDRLPAAGNGPGEPGIYVLSSGMMVEHTPSYHYAAAILNEPSCTIAFVGYCDPDTPGGKLLATPHGDSFLFETLDYTTHVRAHVEQFDLSGHADREELLDYVLARDPRAIVLTHGDPEAREWFDEELAIRAPNIKVTDPEPGVTYQV